MYKKEDGYLVGRQKGLAEKVADIPRASLLVPPSPTPRVLQSAC